MTFVQRRTVGFALFVVLIGLLPLVGCSDDSPPPTAPDAGWPAPVPEGVLLAGDPSGNALAATRLLPPSPAAPDEILGNLLTTRLTGILSPTATVGEVNAALVTHDVRIVSMDAGNALMTLRIPAVAARAEAAALARALVDDGAMLFAAPAEVALPQPEQVLPDPDKDLPPAGAGALGHLQSMRMTAAWNARRLADRNNHRVTVLVPDWYTSATPSSEIGAQSFVADAASPFPAASGGWYPGNHGFHCAGIIGANFDASGPTGTNPDPTLLLDIRSKHVTGLAASDFYLSVVQAFPATGHFVVSTSLGYGTAAQLQKNDFINIAFGALSWRVWASPQQHRFIHATAAGNEAQTGGLRAEAAYGGAFNAAAMWDDPRDLIPADSLSTAEWAGLNAAWDAILAQNPQAAGRLTNTLVVGSSDESGAESSFSNRNPHVRAVGEKVFAPCAVTDPGLAGDQDLCNGTTARYSGTSMATPFVAGLAAYLWNLDPTRTVAGIRAAIQTSYDEGRLPGRVDAFAAALLLDDSFTRAPVRSTLLDVAGATAEAGPNGVFDEMDIEAFLTWFEHYETRRSVEGDNPDDSRYDLNGDRRTGEYAATAGFDLDLNGGIAGDTSRDVCGAAQLFHEAAADDRAVLTYYAYSDLYQGDTDRRDELLCGAAAVEISRLPARVEPGAVHTLTVRTVRRDTGTEVPAADVAVDIRVTGGTASLAAGTTDAHGELAVDVSMFGEGTGIPFANEIIVRATAHFDDGDVVATAQAVRPNAITMSVQRVEMLTEAYFFVDPTPSPGGQIVYSTDNDSTRVTDDVDAYTYSELVDESGTAFGMTARGRVQVQFSSSVAGSADQFAGASFATTSQGFTQLDSPNFDVVSYTAWARSRSDASVDFVVSGDPATFTITGSHAGDPNGYYVWIFGPRGTVYECHGDDGPCTIGGSGALPPGRYSFVVAYHKVADIRWSESSPEGVVSGTVDMNASLAATLAVAH